MSTITPIGLQLTGRLAVVVGGGPVAARRARLLARAGARLTVIAPQLCSDMTELIASLDFAHRTTGGEPATWVPRGYVDGDVSGAWLVATATGNPQIDDEVAAWAEQHQIFCFKGGDAEHATAWAPALVEHGDATIAVVSSKAKDPKPRRTISLRNKISSLLRTTTLDRTASAASSSYAVGAGEVVLVGGGPGAVELLTLAAKQAIDSAEVLVIDRLAPREVLNWVGSGVEIIDVGKSGGDHPVSQSEINEILVDRALARRQVIRLKGGDPYVFGRGGEELDACRAAGVPVSVIPGVTSAVSVPAAAGIPVTHRGVARGFSVITAHSDLGAAPLADNHTLVLLMGVAQLEKVSTTLIAQGNPGSTPCAIIEDGFGPRQRTTVATLETLAQRAREADVKPPAITVIGDVVLRADVLRDSFSTFVTDLACQ
jgi:uroporphyrin-III C-methyltransferase/precorrin-2 dehydrogenase/sirohydrochlorin ferrochelatase